MQSADVVIVGAGNAGLCAALSAREAGARVLVLEKAPRNERGGNTAFTGGLLRFAFESIDDFRPLLPDYGDSELAELDVGRYSQRDYAADLDRVTEGLSDESMVQTLTGNSYPTMVWMRQRGVRWLPAMGRQSFRGEDGRYHFFGNLILEAVGGGQGLSDRLFEIAEESGIEIAYDTKAATLQINDLGAITGLRIRGSEGYSNITCSAVVLAAGGFEANKEMRTRYLGPDWELAKVRGTRFNTGDAIRMALDIGAQSYGHWSCCHAVAWDLLSNDVGDLRIGDLHQKHSYPIGVIVNRDGKRFVDEGADYRNYTYAKYGREILKQPGRQAFQVLDGKRTLGIEPPKSNWAVPIDQPPYEGYAVTCGITFTFGGLRIDTHGQVPDTENRPMPGLSPAGELAG